MPGRDLLDQPPLIHSSLPGPKLGKTGSGILPWEFREKYRKSPPGPPPGRCQAQPVFPLFFKNNFYPLFFKILSNYFAMAF